MTTFFESHAPVKESYVRCNNKNDLGKKIAKLLWLGHVFWTNLGKIVSRKIVKVTKNNETFVWSAKMQQRKISTTDKTLKIERITSWIWENYFRGVWTCKAFQ